MNKLLELAEKRIGRRKFLAGAGAAGAAATLAGCSSTGVNPGQTIFPGITDVDILNFALNLEYLEAEFYLYAATGQGLSTSFNDVGGAPGTTVGGAQVPGLTAAQQNILNELAFDEQAHVRALRTLLAPSGTTGPSGTAPLGGTAAVSRPNLNIGSAFVTLATAAGIPSASTFNPYLNFDTFLLAAFIFEDVGVTAYAGAAPLISVAGVTGPTNVLAYASSILAVEAYHAALIRTTIVANTVAAAAAIPPVPYPYFTYANQVSTLRGTLGGGNETALTLPGGTTSAPTATTIVPATTANAIAFARTTDQVLHIVYGTSGKGVSSGGFFPNGMNGKITVTQS